MEGIKNDVICDEIYDVFNELIKDTYQKLKGECETYEELSNRIDQLRKDMMVKGLDRSCFSAELATAYSAFLRGRMNSETRKIKIEDLPEYASLK